MCLCVSCKLKLVHLNDIMDLNELQCMHILTTINHEHVLNPFSYSCLIMQSTFTSLQSHK